jgi:glycosyltransferase involved in cell wall biosynthesis
MHILVNALSVNNQSGSQLLAGHIGMLANWLEGRHRFTILHHSSGESLKAEIHGVDWYRCPEIARHWTGRSLWEFCLLPLIFKSLRGDCLFSPSGIANGRIHAPQVVFCQNPWALVPAVRKVGTEVIKAMIQRHAYRGTVATADTIVFNSDFMRKAYLKNASSTPRRTTVVYQGISEEFIDAAAMTHQERDPNLILSVSAWGGHKGLETVIEGLALLRKRTLFDTRLAVVGQWPSPQYRRFIEKTIQTHGMQNAVKIHGHVPTAELHRLYAQAKIFCLMSHCESFGFPAIEAQAFGTPTVCANSTAMPEIQGEGGLYPAPGDANGTATALGRLLIDDELWRELSSKAKVNAHKYRWKRCSRDLIGVFDEIAETLSHG